MKCYNVSFKIEFISVRISTQVQILDVDLNKISFSALNTKTNLGKKWVQNLSII